MPIVVTSSVDKVLENRKCDLASKFCVLEADSDESMDKKLLKLNRALCLAQSDNIILEILQKRVKIYADLKLYKQCNENEIWIDQIQKSENGNVQLYVNKNINIDNTEQEQKIDISEKIVISADKLIAKKEIKSGKLVAIDLPFCGVLLENSVYRRCKNCLKCNQMNLIPCLKCQFAMFCSTQCREAAEFHHQFECAVTQVVAKIPFHLGGLQVAIRVLFELLVYFNSSVQQLMEFVDFYRKHPKRFNKINPFNAYIERFAALLALKHYPDDNSHSELLHTISNVLDIYKNVSDLFVTKEQKHFLTQFLLTNSKLDLVVHYDNMLQQPSALSVNFYYNLMPHSCASNVHAIINDGVLYYYTKYPVKANCILTYNHVLNFESTPFDIRKHSAKKCGITCMCQACLKEYPILYGMKVYDLHVLENAINQQDDILKMKKKELKYALKENCKYIDAHYPENFPSQEISILQTSNSMILSKLVNSKTFKPEF